MTTRTKPKTAPPAPTHRDPERTEFGARFRAARLAAGHESQRAAAKIAGIETSTLSRYETTSTDPRWQAVVDIITALHMPLEMFFPPELIREASDRLASAKRRPAK